MASPVATSYSVESGSAIYGGRPDPLLTPDWMVGKPLFEWFEIPGTSGAGGAQVDAYSGLAIKQSTAEILIGPAGGHGDGWDNRIVSLSLLQDNFTFPAWTLRMPSSLFADVIEQVSYYADGKPTSRHTRYQTQYCAPLDKIVYLGSPSVYAPTTASSFVQSNAFDLATNTWDPIGTYPDVYPNGSVYGSATDDLGNIWCRGQKWQWATNTFQACAFYPRNPECWDPVRRQLFSLYWGDGQGASAVLGANTISENGLTVRNITFNASDAWTEFAGLGSAYCAMTYNPLNDTFLYYYGYGISRGVVYVITPNAGTVWDMSKLVQGPGSILPSIPTVTGAGIQNRFQYVESLKGIVMLATSGVNLYFMRLG